MSRIVAEKSCRTCLYHFHSFIGNMDTVIRKKRLFIRNSTTLWQNCEARNVFIKNKTEHIIEKNNAGIGSTKSFSRCDRKCRSR